MNLSASCSDISGDQMVESRFSTIHPELPMDIRESYQICNSKHKSNQFSSKLLLHYDDKMKELKHYFAQIIQNKSNKHFLVVSRCGPLNSDLGTLSKQGFMNLKEARQCYKSIFLDVVNASNIRCLEHGHSLMSFYPAVDDDEYVATTMMSDNIRPGVEYTKYQSFAEEKRAFIKLFIQDYNETETMEAMGTDLSRTVLGYITPYALKIACGVLDEMELIYKNKLCSDNVVGMSNYFHLLIPSCRGRDHKLPVIDSIEKVFEKRELIKAITSRSYRTRLTMPYAVKVDQMLAGLQHQFVELENGFMVKSICECISNTGQSLAQPYPIELLKVYEFNTLPTTTTATTRSQKHQKQKTKLLWHGSTLANIYSILSNGLEAAKSLPGNMFGSGIYFADTVAKAAKHCHANRDKPEVILLLCEVDHGNTKLLFTAEPGLVEPPPGFDSVKGVGRHQFRWNDYVHDAYGSEFMFGSLQFNSVAHTHLHYNEYVVYRKAQVKIRYLLKLKLSI